MNSMYIITNHMSTDRQEFLLLFQSVSVFCCCSWFPLRLHRQLHGDLLQVIITTSAAMFGYQIFFKII